MLTSMLLSDLGRASFSLRHVTLTHGASEVCLSMIQ